MCIIAIAANDGAANAGVDYVIPAASVTFQPGEESVDLQVDIMNDSDPEETEEFFLTLDSKSNDQNHIGSPARAYIIIEDTDKPTGVINI